jgi:nucleotide-binding universal stress UspA family protein
MGELMVMLSRVGAADGPILIAFDGSAASRSAVSDAARLFAPRPALVVTVWEPGLAYAMPQMGTELVPAPIVDPATALTIDEGVHSQAEHVAGEGAKLARSLGLDAQPLAVPGERNVPETILHVAEDNHASAIVVGSRGLSGFRARLEGSTTKSLLKHASAPVLVVHEPPEDR